MDDLGRVGPEGPSESSAGASARRMYEKRKTSREQRVRSRFPRVGGLLLRITPEPQSTRAWAEGAAGEAIVGARLDGLTGPNARVLHDRRIPGTRANIDHIVVVPTGIYVVDTKKYKGRPATKVEGGLFRRRTVKLTVAGRDRTNLIDGVEAQIHAVRTALDPMHLPVHGVLCFVDADWPTFGGAFVVRGVAVTWPRRLAKTLQRPGPLGPNQLDQIAARLAAALPPA